MPRQPEIDTSLVRAMRAARKPWKQIEQLLGFSRRGMRKALDRELVPIFVGLVPIEALDGGREAGVICASMSGRSVFQAQASPALSALETAQRLDPTKLSPAQRGAIDSVAPLTRREPRSPFAASAEPQVATTEEKRARANAPSLLLGGRAGGATLLGG